MEGLFTERKPSRERRGLVYLRSVTLSVGTHLAAAILLFLVATGRAPSDVAPSPPERSLVWIEAANPSPGSSPGAGTPANSVTLPGSRRMGAGGETVRVPAPTVQPSVVPVEAVAFTPVAPIPSATLSDVGIGVPNPLAPPGPNTGGGPGGRGPGPGDGPGEGAGGQEGLGIGPGSGPLVSARPLRQVRPQYTTEAMRAKVQGLVTLEALVLPDGSVGEVRIARSLDSVFGLDREAMRAVKAWTFAPATRGGTPIPMWVSIELTFTLR
jgi:periplasmic protein TonB